MKKYKVIVTILILLICIFSLLNVPVIKKNYVNKNVESDKKEIELSINKWIEIPTYDKHNEVTHPKVLYFPEKVNGYHYYMVSTPYHNNNTYIENPSITVSNDGIKFIEPKGINNPVSGFPSKEKNDTYYSDPFMMYDDNKFKLFYRYTKSYENGKYIRNGYNYLYYKESTDGINFSDEKIILDNDFKERYMSPSIVKNNDVYKIWYTNYDCKLRYIESTDLSSFSKPVIVNIENFNKGIWHSEIQYIDNTYHIVFMTRNNYLYYSSSKDGLNFMEPKLIKSSLKELQGSKYYIYKTSYIIHDNTIELYIPYRVNGIWKMYYKLYNINDFYNSLE